MLFPDAPGWVMAAVGAVLGGLAGAVPGWWLAMLASRRRSEARVAALEAQLTLISQVVTPINVAMQQMLIKQLTHAHAPVLDELLSRILDPGLSLDDQAKLAEMLAERISEEDVGELERDAAVMLPMIMRRIRADLDGGVAPRVSIMVSVPQDQLPDLVEVPRLTPPVKTA